jgi:hypothetical protein
MNLGIQKRGPRDEVIIATVENMDNHCKRSKKKNHYLNIRILFISSAHKSKSRTLRRSENRIKKEILRDCRYHFNFDGCVCSIGNCHRLINQSVTSFF